MEGLLTVREVATMLRVDPETVRKWIRAGKLESIELPKANTRAPRRIERASIENLLRPSA